MKENSGNIGRVSLPRLLNLIHKKADAFGVLDVSKDPVKKRFYFKDGLLVSSTSNMLNEVLGRILLQDGILSLKDYEKSLEVSAKDKKRHGEVLISMGILKEEELRHFLTTQLKNRILKVFGWNDGEFSYSRIEGPLENISGPPLHPGCLILEGISLGYYPPQRLEAELVAYMDKALSPVAATGLICRPEDLRLNIQEERFLSSFDGKKTLQELLEGSNLLRHRAASLALSFIITGIVNGLCAAEAEVSIEGEIKEAPAIEAAGAGRLNAELLFAKAKGAVLINDFSAALKMLEQIVELNPLEAEYWAYLGWAIFNENPDNAKKAEKIIKDAIDLDNDLDAAWHFLGMVFLHSGDAAWAEKAFRTALQKNPWMLESLAEIKRLEIKGGLQGPGRGGYLSALGFLEDPFTDAPEQRFLDLPATREKILETVLERIKERSGPLVVEGPAGSGKTTLLLQLVKKLTNEKILCACVLRPPEKELLLIQAINAELGVKKGNGTVKEELLNLGLKVSQNKVHGGHTIIIIDNAHTLSRGCLKFIQYLTRLKTLQTVLFAETSFTDKLSRDVELKELKEKLVQDNIFPVEQLTTDETRSFVLKRLENAKNSGEINFEDLASAPAVAEIREKSEGLPAVILNASADFFKKKAEEAVFTAVVDTVPANELEAPEAIAEHRPKPDIFEIEEGVAIEAAPLAPPARIQPKEILEAVQKTIEAGQTQVEQFKKADAPASAEVKGVGLLEEALSDKTPVKDITTRPAIDFGAPEKKTEAPAGEKPRFKHAFLRLVVIVLAMIILGLVIGSLIGINLPFVGPPKKIDLPARPAKNAQIPQAETRPDQPDGAPVEPMPAVTPSASDTADVAAPPDGAGPPGPVK